MRFRSPFLVVLLLAVASLVLGGNALAQQASITLKNSDAALCHTNNTAWTLTKTADASTINDGDTASWTVTVTKGTTSDNILSVNGFVQVQNTGSADATIGNIVVNLQRRQIVGKKETWVSVAADVADATNGDVATNANIVAAASQEKANLFNYTVSGAQGTFTETAGSGKLTFTDKDTNDIWAITPQQTIAPGATVNLLFSAEFNNTELGLAEGELVRAEVIVSFGNAGARGGSGASAQNIDINGNKNNDADEAYVRSVPTRLTRAVPVLKACNAEVTLTDPGVSTTGTVTAPNFDNGGIGDGATLTDSETFGVSATVTSGNDGGSVCNDAFLKGEEDCADCAVQVLIGYDLTKPLYDDLGYLIGYEPIYYVFPCCTPLNIKASSCIDVEKPSGFEVGDYCTYSRDAYAATCPTPADSSAGCIFTNNYSAAFRSTEGMTVGIYKPPDKTYPNGFVWNDGTKGRNNLRTFLTSVDLVGGDGSTITDDSNNPTTGSGGVLARETAALTLNIRFSGWSGTGMPAGLGDLYYCNPGDALHGKKVSEILAAANTALGTNPVPSPALPTGYTFTSLKNLINNLNLAFQNCTPSTFAETYLREEPCPSSP